MDDHFKKGGPDVIPKTWTWSLCDSFMKVLNGHSATLDENGTEDIEVKREYRNFKPVRIMELLVERAYLTNTSSEELLDDMKDLITTRIKAENSRLDGIQNEQWYKRLTELETKYKVETSGSELDSITFSRLCFMFPHYAVPARAKYLRIIDWSPGIILSLYSRAIGARASNAGGDNNRILALLSTPEFGALIPNWQNLRADVKRSIIVAHLCCIIYQNPSSNDLNTQYALVIRRMDTGLLSEERRIRFLQMNGIITSQGKLTLQAKSVFKYIVLRGLTQKKRKGAVAMATY